MFIEHKKIRYAEELDILDEMVSDFKKIMGQEQGRIAQYLMKQFDKKEFFYKETIEYLKMDLQNREDALYENYRIQELENKLKDFSNDALKHKVLEESNKRQVKNLLYF